MTCYLREHQSLELAGVTSTLIYSPNEQTQAATLPGVGAQASPSRSDADYPL